MQTADRLIENLGMLRHPEGGYYAQCLASDRLIQGGASGCEERRLWTSIYFLLKAGQVSHLHRLAADEVWYFHAGSPLEIVSITAGGRLEAVSLGLDLEAGQRPQALVTAGSWFGSRLLGGDYALVGCMVAPGFEFSDFELARRDELLRLYPQHSQSIEELCAD